MKARSSGEATDDTILTKGLKKLSPHSFPSRDRHWEEGRDKRSQTPRSTHANWKPAKNRPVMKILSESNAGRISELVPIRYGRMLQSPFSFFRGAAAVMAFDLSRTPVTGERVQACGDCHLVNFGGFATPERRLVFDINDFDETLPAPWEWDIKRLAASFVIASRHNRFSATEARLATVAMVRSYRKKMAKYAHQSVLGVWYDRIDLRETLKDIKDPEAISRVKKRLKRAEERSLIDEEFPKLAHVDRQHPVIRDSPPLIFHWQDLNQREHVKVIQQAFRQYRETMPYERRVLLDRYQLMDIANKVVGVGSVGTICAILLLMAEHDDPLFLQVKQARASVLAPYAGKSEFANQGERVVVGQRLMQSASDLFLGWTEGRFGRQYYVRQLRDMKIKPLVELYNPGFMREYAELCGWALARAHARSGRPAVIAGYLGKSDSFDEAIADFATLYADQNEKDFQVLVAAAKSGVIEARFES